MNLLNITNDISSEIIVIYGVIALVVALIVVIILLDKKEKKRVNLLQTQELRLMDLRKSDEEAIEEFKKTEEIEVFEDELVEEKESMIVKKANDDIGIEKIDIEINEDMYVEDDLEKTQAQLHLEELTKELQKGQSDSVEKIAKFEEEQEENAIISYKELLKVCDKLYDNNEKVQYMDEGDEPITINQLRSKFNNSNTDIEVL